MNKKFLEMIKIFVGGILNPMEKTIFSGQQSNQYPTYSLGDEQGSGTLKREDNTLQDTQWMFEEFSKWHETHFGLPLPANTDPQQSMLDAINYLCADFVFSDGFTQGDFLNFLADTPNSYEEFKRKFPGWQFYTLTTTAKTERSFLTITVDYGMSYTLEEAFKTCENDIGNLDKLLKEQCHILSKEHSLLLKAIRTGRLPMVQLFWKTLTKSEFSELAQNVLRSYGHLILIEAVKSKLSEFACDFINDTKKIYPLMLVDIVTNDNAAAFRLAAESGDAIVVDTLLHSLDDHPGKSKQLIFSVEAEAYRKAVNNNHPKVVQRLIGEIIHDKSLLTQLLTVLGEKQLPIAAGSGFNQIVKLILEAIKIEREVRMHLWKSGIGSRALEEAVKNNRKEAVILLLESLAGDHELFKQVITQFFQTTLPSNENKLASEQEKKSSNEPVDPMKQFAQMILANLGTGESIWEQLSYEAQFAFHSSAKDALLANDDHYFQYIHIKPEEEISCQRLWGEAKYAAMETLSQDSKATDVDLLKQCILELLKEYYSLSPKPSFWHWRQHGKDLHDAHTAIKLSKESKHIQQLVEEELKRIYNNDANVRGTAFSRLLFVLEKIKEFNLNSDSYQIRRSIKLMPDTARIKILVDTINSLAENKQGGTPEGKSPNGIQNHSDVTEIPDDDFVGLVLH